MKLKLIQFSQKVLRSSELEETLMQLFKYAPLLSLKMIRTHCSFSFSLRFGGATFIFVINSQFSVNKNVQRGKSVVGSSNLRGLMDEAL